MGRSKEDIARYGDKDVIVKGMDGRQGFPNSEWTVGARNRGIEIFSQGLKKSSESKKVRAPKKTK